MINGYTENLKTSWHERLGNKICQINMGIVDNFNVQKEKLDENTLCTTLIKEGKPLFVDIYITDDEKRLKKIVNKIYNHTIPYLIYDYRYINNVLYIKRTEHMKKKLEYVMIDTKKNSSGKTTEAEYRYLNSGKMFCKLYFKRDSSGQVRQEIVEDLELMKKAIIKSDQEGKWLSFEEFCGEDLIWIQRYLR